MTDQKTIPKDLLKKVRLIEIHTRKAVNDILAGEYHSAFKGRGIEFEEVREYSPGDDVRSIDWNVTARMGHPYIKSYKEERELTVFLLVDVSSSGDFGTGERTKMQTAAEISALLAFSAIKNNDKVGLILFSDTVDLFIPPKKRRKHVLRVIRELLFFKPKKAGTDIRKALDYFLKVQKKKCIAFLVSDFFDTGFDSTLTIASRKHDLIALRMSDPREVEMPDIGLVQFEDIETGELVTVDTGSASARRFFSERGIGISRDLDTAFRYAGIDTAEIRTDKSYIQPLQKLFHKRAL